MNEGSALSPHGVGVAAALPGHPQAIGCYGKLPSVGDFITRRLPPTFVQTWDRWLQAGMAGSRARLGERWEELYLTFPVWRFAIAPGSLGATGWAGVMMPSTDRVGRCFPLTLAAPLPAGHFAELSMTDLDRWLTGFEAVGLAGLDGQHVDQFDLHLRGLPAVPGASHDALPAPDVWSDPACTGHWPLADGLSSALARIGGRLMLSHLGRRALWWVPGGEPTGGTIRVDGWPMSPEAFDALILQD